MPSLGSIWAGLACIALVAGCVDDDPPTSVEEDPISLGGTIIYGPTSVRTGSSTIDVFAAGGDATLYTRRFDETAKLWSAWRQIDGTSIIGSGLAAVRDNAGGIKLFTLNRTSLTPTVITLALTPSGTVASGWRAIGSYSGWLASDAPAATIDPAGTIHVFSRDSATNALVHTQCFSCTAPEPTYLAWDNAGATLKVYSTPAVVSQAVDDFHIYYKDRDASDKEAVRRLVGSGTFAYYTWDISALPIDAGMWSYSTGSTAPADYTPATAVPVDTAQGLHAINNVRTNPTISDNARGTCGGFGEEGVMRLDLPQTARVQIDTSGAGYDTVIYVRRADGVSQVSDLDGVSACNDDVPGGTWSALDLRLAAGTYYVFLDAYNGGASTAGKQPTVHFALSYYNGPAATARAGGIDVYSVGTDNRLWVNSHLPLGFTGWSLINGPEPIADGGDYQNTTTLGIALNGAGTCSHVFARAFPASKLIEKGCGESASWSLDNLAGGQFSIGWGDPIPNFSANPYDASWGPVNSAWNQTLQIGAAGAAAGNSALYLTARWPTELYAYDFDDDKTGLPAWDTYAAHRYVTLLGYEPPVVGGLLPPADHGAEVTSKLAYLPGGVKAARLIDHGSCVTRMPWVGSTGLLSQLKTVYDDAVYLGVARSLNDAGISGGTFTWDLNRFEPSFTHFRWDPITGIHSDGIAFDTHLHWSGGEGDIWYHSDGQYTFGLEQGLPKIYPIRTDGRVDHGGLGLVIAYINAWFTDGINMLIWGKPYAVDPYAASQFMDPNEPYCDGTDVHCLLANRIPFDLDNSIRSQVTAMLGDPMKAQVCGFDSDCPAGHGFSCHENYCLVPIHAGEPGYSSTSPSTNWRTEWDRLDSGPPLSGHVDVRGDYDRACTPVAIGAPVEASDLTNCRVELTGALASALGVSPTDPTVNALVGQTKDYQFGCVEPRRPNCGGDGMFTPTTGYFGGYPCRDGNVGEGPAYTGHVAGRCTWRPAFKRLNVLPTSLELVWSEAGQPASADERIVRALAPGSACQAPRPSEVDVSTATDLPKLVDEGPVH